MLKVLFSVTTCFVTLTLQSQSRYYTVLSNIEFTSKAELELIKASSNQVNGIIDPSTREFAFSVKVNSFKGFNSSLQREHFNEKYMESEKYPDATFTGKIIEDNNYLSDGTYDVRAKGDLNIHGHKQSRIIKSKLTVKGKSLTLESTFTVPLTDHDISIPKIVSQKIATEIEVVFKASMTLR